MKGAALPTGRLANQGVLSHMYNVSEKDSLLLAAAPPWIGGVVRHAVD